MKAWYRVRSAWRNLFGKQQVEKQLDEEVRAWVEMVADERMAAGMAEGEARRSALVDAEGMEQVKQAVRDGRAGTCLEVVWQDVVFSLRQLRRNPGFAISVVVALALGIGANTAIFSVVNAVLLKPLTYPDADRIVQFLSPSSVIANDLANIPEYHVFARQTSIFKDIAAYDIAGPGFNLTGERPEQLRGIHVTEGYFRVFGTPMAVGRAFTKQEDLPHGGNVVVLSYGLWQRKFAGDPAVVGKSLSLGNEPYTIVGVVGKDYVSDPGADIWLPFQFDPGSTDTNYFFRVAGMLRPGLTVAAANEQLKLAAAQYHRDFPKSSLRQQFVVGPLRDSIIGDARNSLLVMLGAVGLVLLIACANVANLLLVRATGRRREFAIRSALGAGRGRIVRQLLTESLLLSVGGGVVGLGLGFVGVRALLAISPAGLPRIGEDGSAIGLDWRLLLFTLGISLLTGILLGLFPALAASRADLNTALKENSNRSGAGFRQGKARSLLVVSEVSLALVLLIGSVLLIRTFIALHGVGAGFDAHNILTMEMSLNGERYQKTEGMIQLLQQARPRLNGLPGVEMSAASYWLPADVEDGMGFQIIGRPVDKEKASGKWMSMSPDYLRLFKIPVLRGRGFTEEDTAGKPGVALINQAMADRYWPNEDPIGQHVLAGRGFDEFRGEPVREIIGIVANMHDSGLDKPASAMMMIPLAQVPDGYAAAYANIQPLFWVVRTHGDPHQAIAAVSEQLRMASGGFPVAHVRTMDEVIGRSTARQSFNMLLLTIFGVVALFLASVGIYGLMAYSVEQRTQEMGVRIALGADRSAIRKLVVWHGMRLALVGVGVGICAAFGLMHLIASILFGVKAWDPLAFMLAPVILSAVALGAVWLPAARASKVDPMRALRAE